MLALIAPEGKATSDRRLINPGALTWRENLPLMFRDRDTHGAGSNTPETVHVGNVTNLRRQTIGDETWVVGDVTYDSDEQAREAQRLAREDKLSGISLDGAGAESEIVITSTDEFGEPTDWLETITAMEIVGVTQVPMPAFDGARLVDTLDTPMVAAGSWRPPREWFEMPEPDQPTPLTVLPSGQFYGHAANGWDQCHIGYQNACVTPPNSPTGYARFNRRTITCDDGTEILAGNISMGIGHAPLSLSAEKTVDHYDHTEAVVAYGRMTDGRIAPWVCGAVRPDVPDDRIEQFARVGLSGDWRDEGHGLDLVACLAVPVEGFPVLRAQVASGKTMALVASGPAPFPADPIAQVLRVQDRMSRALTLIVGELGDLGEKMADLHRPLLVEKVKALAASIETD